MDRLLQSGKQIQNSPYTLAWVVFVLAWSVTTLADRIKRADPFDTLTILLVSAILLVIFRPRLTWAAVFLSLAQLAIALRGWRLSYQEHIYVGAFVSLGILAAFSAASTKSDSWNPRPEMVWKYIRPYLIYLVSAGIFAAGFAKLNHDFFDPDFSVGAILYQWLRESPFFFFLHDGRLGDWTGILGAVVLELLAPPLLIFRKTRVWGLLLLWILALLLVLNPQVVLVDFIGLFFVISFAAVPEEIWRRVGNQSVLLTQKCLQLFRLSAAPAAMFVKVLYATLVVLLVLISWNDAVDLKFQSEAHTRILLLEVVRYSFAAFILLSLVVLSGFLRKWDTFIDPRAWWTPGLVLLISIFTAHQVSPYFGLHNETTLTMASNARLRPSDSNHFIFRKIPTFGPTREVEIVESKNPDLKAGLRMPMMVMLDRARTRPKDSFTYKIEGKEVKVTVPVEELKFHGPSFIVWALRLKPYEPTTLPSAPTKPPPGMTPEQWREKKREILRERMKSVHSPEK